jgi:FkbM family methyltransferase
MPLFLPHLKAQGRLDDLHMTIGHVGSRKLSDEDEYGEQGWGCFPNLTILGFEADDEACDAANQAFAARQDATWNEFHLPLALSDRVGPATLYLTRQRMCSSLYPPNQAFIQRFPLLADYLQVDATVEIETTTLDTFCASETVESIDFLQIDVQGAELNVLKGGQALIDRSVYAVQIEVEFSPLYLGQPLFADLDLYLRGQGFELFDLGLPHHCQRSPISSMLRSGQKLWSEAFYLRDGLQPRAGAKATLDFTQPAPLLRLACIADAMEFTDYALELFAALTLHHGDNPDYNLADDLALCLSAVPEIVAGGVLNFPVLQPIRDRLSPKILEALS